ncbi:MAG: hypothetical protein OHK0057_08940 [Thermoflexibacter sp.]
MKKNLIYFLSLSFLLSLSACRGEVKENATEENNISVAEETTENQVFGSESSCTETSIALQGEDFSLENFKLEGLQVYRDLMQSEDLQYPALVLTMTNYPKEGTYVSDPTKENEVQLIINFSGKAGSNITTQTYDIAGEGFGKSDVLIVSFRTKDKSYALNLPSGKGEITYLSAEKVCGTVEVQSQNRKTIVKGSFSCNLK